MSSEHQGENPVGDGDEGRSDATIDAPNRVTPMMTQYLEIKRAHPDSLLFYRMGDFYELFFEDAKLASQALGIVLTKRGKHLGREIPMCGVPIERSDDYLQKLIASGYRVAVCEQTEHPSEARKRGAKSVVKRGVVRLVTPGTVTEERLLEPGRANLLVALVRQRDENESYSFGVAAVDISTGVFEVHVAEFGGLGSLLARLEPREIVASEMLLSDATLLGRLREGGAAITPLNDKAYVSLAAEKKLLDYYGLGTLEGLGLLSRLEINAAGLCLAYIGRTQLAAKPRLNRPCRVDSRITMEIDAATRINLELMRSQSGQRQGTLLSVLDRTVTSAGARTLADWLASPLRDVPKIAARHDAIAFLVDDPLLRAELRRRLREAPDMTRALGRLALDRGGPRDLAALRDGLLAAKQSGAVLAEKNTTQLLAEATEFLANFNTALPQLLAAALGNNLPLDRRTGNFVAAAFDLQLDEARTLRDESRRVIASLQGQYCERVEIRQLKIKHNNFLGYFVEVNQAQGDKLLKAPFNTDFIHRQTMADAMRFSTSELSQLESRINNAAEEALTIENQIFTKLVAQALEMSADLESCAKCLAELDALTALAEIASEADWTRPQVDNSLAFRIEAGRHPVVEAALRERGEPFVPNDCDLSGTPGGKNEENGGKLAVITGPNMAGKSTFLRQNALIAILAQIGSFVPAKMAHIGIVDRLFSRVGASDDLARGRSTFMVEMVETAAILNQATERSLVILDEIGRGTATYDGLSIAWAVMEHLHEVNRSRALFATHFHELTHLHQKLSRLHNLCMRVSDWREDVVFLHEVAPGSADRSYGVQVARLAGLPRTVVERARGILAELELNDRRTPVERLVADLPLFAISLQSESPVRRDALREALELIDPNDLSPRQALEALYNLKRVMSDD